MALTPQDKARRIAAAQKFEHAANFPAAIAAYKQLIKEDPNDAGLYYMLSAAQLASLEVSDALRSIRQAIKRNDKVPDFFALQAIILRASHRVDDAIEAVDRGLALEPNNLSAIAAKGDLLYIRGDLEEGIALMEPAFHQGCTNPQYLATLGRLLVAAKRSDDAIPVLKRALLGQSDNDQQLAWPHMQLGQIYEKQGDYEQAWEHYEKANRYRGTLFQPALHMASVKENIAYWSADRLARLPRARNRKAEQLVFIVGMPRSGTSLIEQILASHPDVYGGGELNHVAIAARDLLTPTLKEPSIGARLDALRQPVVDRISRSVHKQMVAPCPHAKRFTDKMPQNFRHLGLIELLFPQAKIIQTKRDPRDICMSCFTHLFGGGNNQPFAGNLTHLGIYYKTYEQLMDHWKSVLSLPILEVEYEKMVDDLEGYARRIIEHVGLPWNDACLRFYETKRDVITESTDQVRKPIYASSIGRWKRFERHLGPLLAALGMDESTNGPSDN